jgi:hypothetical protein
MWSLVFGLLTVAAAVLATIPELAGWNAFFWVLALLFLGALIYTLAGAIGHHRAREERAGKTAESRRPG